MDETYLDRPFELPMTWVDVVPRTGILTTTYYSGPNSMWASKSLRKELCKQVFLVGGRAHSHAPRSWPPPLTYLCPSHPAERAKATTTAHADAPACRQRLG